jgi:hypothetical protein
LSEARLGSGDWIIAVAEEIYNIHLYNSETKVIERRNCGGPKVWGSGQVTARTCRRDWDWLVNRDKKVGAFLKHNHLLVLLK